MNIKDLTFNQKIGLLKTLNETYTTYGFGESLSDKAKKLSHSVLDSFEDEPQSQKLGELVGLNNELQPKDLETILNEFVKVHRLNISLDAIKHYASRVMYMFPELNKNKEKMYSKDDIIAILPKMRDNWVPKHETIVDSFTQYITENL